MSHGPAPQPKPPFGLVISAFAAIYLIWGSTYLGIRFAIETMPPFMMGGARFLLAGGALYALLRGRGTPAPEVSHWMNALAVGALLLGIGNGGVNWAEQKVPSGVVALLIAVTPIWFSLLDWLRPGGTRPRVQTGVGILVGFCGMVWLVTSHGAHLSGGLDLPRIGGVIAASIAWAAGSLYARYTPKPETPLMGGALQMLAGGAILTFVGLVTGEADAFSFARVSNRSLAAFSYLTVIGSMVGFTAYSWLLKVSTPARISTYAYVNPVIAVFLGWALAHETVNSHVLGAAAVIILAVIIISTGPPATADRTAK
jgi:drug/metabolite transporter (DMT)-like permease